MKLAINWAIFTLMILDEIISAKLEEVGMLKEKTKGNYQITYQPTQLKGNIFFYRLQIGNKIEFKKMILIK